jgi:dTDP-4-dehydrorhamnose reductase
MPKQHMLVTGGSGYLGGWVVRLARANWRVSATFLTRPVDPDVNGERGVNWRRLDVRDAAAVDALMADVHPAVVVHTAAANPGGDADFAATNVDGTRHVARATRSVGARLIHISTDVIFDGEKGSYVEEDLPQPITPYGRSKALAEEEVRASEAEAVIVRTSLIYGWRPRIDRHTRWVVEGLRAGNPPHLFTDELRCPMWVESLAAAVVELAVMTHTGVPSILQRRHSDGALHVAGAQSLSRYQFGVRLARFHGVDPGPIVPARSRESGLVRPLDCTLDCSRARALLRTPLPGVDEVLGRHTL